MANKFLSGINVTGTTTLNTVANAGTDTDKFLVLDAAGNIDFRTGAELLSDINVSASYIPYTDATGNVDLGEYNIKSGAFKFDLTPSGTVAEGTMQWNSSDGTVDIGLKGGNVVLQVGQETVYEVRNETGTQIPNGTAVYANGVTAGSGRITAAPYVADGSVRENRFLGLATENISNGVNGFVTHFGYVRGLDTRGTSSSSISVGDETWAVGDVLYVHPTVAGKLTNVKPQHEIAVAIIITRHQSSGILFVRPSSGGHLEDIHDVAISSVANNDGLFYESSTSLWKNKSIATILGYTPADAANIPTRTETVFTATANQSVFTVNYTVGSVEVFYNGSKMAPAEFTATNGTSITLASGIPEGTILTVVANGIGGGASKAAFSATAPMAYDSNTGVFSMPAATGSQNGYLTSANWTTFNNKQNALTLTVTGSSGAASLTGATLNIPTYTLAGLGGQPALSGTGFVKISGTTISYDNSTYLTGITSGQVTGALGYTPLSSSGSVTIGGYLTVTGAGSSSSIYMSDSDEGQREIHCNSNRIGFLTQAGGWGAYCDDSGNWTAVGDVTAYSDARVKENVKTIEGALDKVLALRGVSYTRIGSEDGKTKIGVIAQETLPIVPEVVNQDEDGMYNVAYGNMGGLFIEAIKELKKENNELRDILKRNNLI
jgi:hypothetical protein